MSNRRLSYLGIATIRQPGGQTEARTVLYAEGPPPAPSFVGRYWGLDPALPLERGEARFDFHDASFAVGLIDHVAPDSGRYRIVGAVDSRYREQGWRSARTREELARLEDAAVPPDARIWTAHYFSHFFSTQEERLAFRRALLDAGFGAPLPLYGSNVSFDEELTGDGYWHHWALTVLPASPEALVDADRRAASIARAHAVTYNGWRAGWDQHGRRPRFEDIGCLIRIDDELVAIAADEARMLSSLLVGSAPKPTPPRDLTKRLWELATEAESGHGTKPELALGQGEHARVFTALDEFTRSSKAKRAEGLLKLHGTLRQRASRDPGLLGA